jgi:hypothetical protein
VYTDRSTSRKTDNVGEKSWYVRHVGELNLLCYRRRVDEQNHIYPLLYYQLLVSGLDHFTFPVSSLLPAVRSGVGHMRVGSWIENPSVDQV